MSDASDPRHATGESRPKTTNSALPFKPEAVDSPAHYSKGKDDPYEVWKVLRAWGLEGDALRWTAVKYLARAGRKAGSDLLEDLRKSKWYVDKLVEREQEARAPRGKDVTVGGRPVEIVPLETFATSMLDGVLLRGAPDPEVESLLEALRQVRDLCERGWKHSPGTVPRYVGIPRESMEEVLKTVNEALRAPREARENQKNQPEKGSESGRSLAGGGAK